MTGVTDLHEGARIGDLVVLENRGRTLRIGTPQLFPTICLFIGIASIVAWLALVWLFLVKGDVGGAVFGSEKFSAALLIAAFTGLALAAGQLGLSYTIDGDQQEVIKYRFLPVRRWRAGAFESVMIRVGHQGAREILILSLEPPVGGKPLVFGITPCDERGRPLISSAARISELLSIPVARKGAPVQGA